MTLRRRLSLWLGESVAPFGPSWLKRAGSARALSASAGSRRLRVSPRHGVDNAAVICPSRLDMPPSASDVDRCLSGLERREVVRCFTPALEWADAGAFLEAGFEVYESLHLLVKDLDQPPPLPLHNLSRGRRVHQGDVLKVDQLAFSPFWQFDRYALRDARRATPTSRYSVAVQGRVVGYAITGHARTRGYLQRLAVHPDAQGRGLASSLVMDGISWLWHRGVRQVFVNTQHDNHRALELYERLGFQQQERGLVVLHWRQNN